jgi:hypothetical protein
LNGRHRQQAGSYKVGGVFENVRFIEEKRLNDVFCALSAVFCLALGARVYDSSRTTTTPEKPP